MKGAFQRGRGSPQSVAGDIACRLITRMLRAVPRLTPRSDYRSRNLASKVSRRASPTKLKATTVTITMRPAG